ncbi:MAG: GlsB/YeaQ/YmgE family stress response membrane protein [Asticcacaulis sp.]
MHIHGLMIDTHLQNLLMLLLVGLIAGWLAHMIAGGRGGLLGNLVVGLIGSFIGGWLASFFGIAFYGFIGNILVSTVGALVLLAIFGLVNRQRV